MGYAHASTFFFRRFNVLFRYVLKKFAASRIFVLIVLLYKTVSTFYLQFQLESETFCIGFVQKLQVCG